MSDNNSNDNIILKVEGLKKVFGEMWVTFCGNDFSNTLFICRTEKRGNYAYFDRRR